MNNDGRPDLILEQRWYKPWDTQKPYFITRDIYIQRDNGRYTRPTHDEKLRIDFLPFPTGNLENRLD